MSLDALLDRLVAGNCLPVVDGTNLDNYTRQHPYVVLAFFNDPKSFPENFDVAVILPEILKSFPQLKGAIVNPSALPALAGVYEVAVYPALVFLYKGEIRQRITRIQSWSDYQAQIHQLFQTQD